MMSGLPTTNRMILGILDPVSRRRMSPRSNSAKSMRPVRPRPLSTTRCKSGKEFAALVALKNSTMSGCPTADLSAATTASNGFELVRLKRSTSTFAIVILSSGPADSAVLAGFAKFAVRCVCLPLSVPAPGAEAPRAVASLRERGLFDHRGDFLRMNDERSMAPGDFGYLGLHRVGEK